MEKLKTEFNTFKEKQEVLNENLKERLNSIELRIQSLKRQTEEHNGTTSTENQVQNIRNELVTFADRIRSLEASHPVTNAEVSLVLNKLKNLFKII